MYSVNVFISHSWAYSDHYDKLAEWIFDENWSSNGTSIQFSDWSVPKDDPIHNARNPQELKDAIYNRIYNSHVVVIPTGMYVNYSGWIQKEIDGCEAYSKMMLAVNPWAQEKKSSVVVDASDKLVGWQKQSVVDGIWALYNQ